MKIINLVETGLSGQFLNRQDYIKDAPVDVSIAICGRGEVPEYANFKPTHRIEFFGTWQNSIYVEYDELFSGPLFSYEFDDVTKSIGEYKAPDEAFILQYLKDLEKIRSFIEEHRHARILINCHAGISRSTAATQVLLTHFFSLKKDQEILDIILRLRPHATPNPEIIRLYNNHKWGQKYGNV